MEQQRPLRLGDLVDDYCPRERRITNHAIVAIVEDAIRQTRCTACESEHVYKGGKAPARRKPKDQQTVLYEQVLANVTSGNAPVPEPELIAPVFVAAAPEPEPAATVAGVEAPSSPVASPTPSPIALQSEPAAATDAPAEPVVEEAWTLNRRLIRASLPRIDGQPPAPRSIPEFTMHQRNVRGSQHFRNGGQNFNGSGNGWYDRNGNNGNGPRGFRSDGQGDGQPGSPNGQRPGGGRRRRRHKPRPQNN